MKTIEIEYFASLKDAVQKDSESVCSESETIHDLFLELEAKYQLNLNKKHLKVAVNDEFTDFSTQLKDGDRVVFIPPVAGG
jgi:molybdopterin converting factor subunit 1